jgi:hypothetical protein
MYWRRSQYLVVELGARQRAAPKPRCTSVSSKRGFRRCEESRGAFNRWSRMHSAEGGLVELEGAYRAALLLERVVVR